MLDQPYWSARLVERSIAASMVESSRVVGEQIVGAVERCTSLEVWK